MLMRAEMETLTSQLATLREIETEMATQTADFIQVKATNIAFPPVVMNPEPPSGLKIEGKQKALPFGKEIQFSPLDGEAKGMNGSLSKKPNRRVQRETSSSTSDAS